MKKRNIILLIALLGFVVSTPIVKAMSHGDECSCGTDNLCSNCNVSTLFNICDKRGRNCVEINTNTVNTDKTYDNFEIRDREIYLNNNEITLEFANIWSELTYKIHVTGANKITYLNSINQRKIDEPLLAQDYPNLYTSDYIPITVVGDGTLEIETANQVKTNAAGERYYKCWRVRQAKCLGGE